MSDIADIGPQLNTARTRVEINSRTIDKLCQDMVKNYSQDLDELMQNVKNLLSCDDEITTEEFEIIALKLPTLLYFTASSAEFVGIRVDVSKAYEKEKFANTYINLSSGTVKEKEYIANEATQAEYIVTIVTTRTYKQLQQKIQAGFELLSAVKKILTRRMQTSNVPDLC
jgi:hypothetical protein